MYLPKSFQIEDLVELQAFMRAYNFASLVTQHAGAPFASHLPFLLDAQRGPQGTLLAHMARANPQWRHFASGKETLAVFWGPHAYISPAWYDTPNQVPTWNYETVHAYGTARIVEDAAGALAILRRLVETYEGGFQTPWTMENLPAGHAEGMTRGIVAFEIEITRLEGKAKLSQNKTVKDRENAASMLESFGGQDNTRTAALMRATI